MFQQSSSLYCQMALFLRRLILMLKRMCLLGTYTFWVRFCPLKQYRIFSICYCGKWQVVSNLEGSGHNLAVGGEAGIFLSDLGRVQAKATHDKGMIWLSRFSLRKDRCSEIIPPSNKGWPLRSLCWIGQPIHLSSFVDVLKIILCFMFFCWWW